MGSGALLLLFAQAKSRPRGGSRKKYRNAQCRKNKKVEDYLNERNKKNSHDYNCGTA